MTIKKSVAFSAAVVGWVFAAGVARAQPIEKDADAERLFKEAQTLMEQRKFAEACPKLESAYRKDQQLGTLLNLAYCHKEQGSTWLAWVEFREAESKATDLKRNDRRDFAREKMKELEPKLGKVVIDPSTKYDVFEVDIEDRRIWDAEKGNPFLAEPGQRKLMFHAKGKKPGVLLVNVGQPKEKIQHVAVPDMADEDPVVGTPIDPVPTAQPTVAPRDEGASKSSWSAQKTFAIVLGVVGVGGAAVGTIFGLKTMSGKCTDGPPAKNGKGGGLPCTMADRDEASMNGAISTISFIASGALLGGAVVLWLTAPKGSSKKSGAVTHEGTTVVGDIGPGWAGLHGTF